MIDVIVVVGIIILFLLPAVKDCIILIVLNIDVIIRGAIGYSWLDGLLRNPWPGVQTPQVLGYSGMRVAEPLVGGSNPYGAGETLRGRGLGPHMSNQGTPWRRFPGITDKNHPTLTGQDTRDWTPPGVHHTQPIG
jgi:hypothetical protein